MSSVYDLVGEKGFVRKTDETLSVAISYKDNSTISAGTHIFYLTVRNSLPDTAIVDDSDSNVLIEKTVSIVAAGTETKLTANFALTQSDLDLDPSIYYYDVKWNDPSALTTPVIAVGNAKFQIHYDITRRNA